MDRKELEGRLGALPGEAVVLFAGRAALRAVPALHGALGGKSRVSGAAIILPSLRGMAAPWVAGQWPTQGAALRAADAAKQDLAFLESGRSARQLAELALWPEGAPNTLENRWEALKSTLLGQGDDWDAWTDWYEARLRGGPANAALELARVEAITKEEWKAGPAVVNARIKELIAEHAQSAAAAPIDPPLPEDASIPLPPAQTRRAPRFARAPDGRIGIARSGPALPDAQALRAEVIRKALALAVKCPEHAQDDRAEIRAACETIVELLDQSSGEEPASAAAIWSQVGTLRAKLRADDRRRALTPEERARDDEPEPLAIGLSEDLRDLVITLDRYAGADPDDHTGADPDLEDVDAPDPTAEEAADAAGALDRGARRLAAKAAADTDLITPAAAAVLRPIAEPPRLTVRDDPKADVVAVGAMGNFTNEAVTKALEEAAAVDPAPGEEAGAEVLELLREISAETKRTRVATERLEQHAEDSSRPSRQISKGAFQAVGALAVPASGVALTWVLANADAIISVFGVLAAYYGLVRIVRVLVQLFGRKSR